MSEHLYTRKFSSAGYDVDVRTLAVAVEELMPSRAFKISAHAEDVLFSFGDDLSQDEIVTLDAAVESHKSTTALAAAKNAKKNSIDRRTAELVVSGFQHNGRTFSSSEVMQKNLSELHRIRESISYPFMMATKDNGEIYAIADAAEIDAMYLTALNAIIDRYQSGNTIKGAVIGASSMEALSGIVDDR